MPNDFQDALTSQIDERLRQLPLLSAPKTFAPRVLAAIEMRARLPWWKCPWSAWPWIIRVLFLAISFSLTTLAGYFAFHLGADLSAQVLFSHLGAAFGFLKPIWNVVAVLANAFVLIMRSGGQLLIWSLAAVAAFFYITCVAFGTVCYRVALNRI
jgi:hypothetical protein